MNEIICPYCKKAFKIDDAGYAEILKQVRDNEFKQELHERLELAEQDKRNAVDLATIKVTSRAIALCGSRTGLTEEEAQAIVIIECSAEFAAADAIA